MKTDFHHHDYDQMKEKSENEVSNKALFSQKQVLRGEPEEADRRLVRFSCVNPSKSSALFKP